MIRKYIYKLRYILIILTALLGLMGLSSSFGYELLDNCSGIPNDGLSPDTMYNEYTKCVEFDPGEDFIFRSNYTNSVSSNFNFTYYGVLDYKTLYTYGSYNGNGIHFMYWNSLGRLIGVSDTTYYNRVANFQINNFCYYGGSDYTGAYQKCANGLKIHNPCMNDNYNVSFSDFVSGVENHVLEKFYLMYFDYGYYIEEFGPVLCGKFDNGFYCINNNFRQEYSDDLCSGITLLENNETSVGNGLTFYSTDFSDSPFSSSGGGSSGSDNNGGGVFPIDYTITNGVMIDDYERRGFDKSVCYGGSFSGNQLITAPGTGLDIFSLYGDGEHNPLGFSTIYDRYSYYREAIIEYRNVGDNSAFFYSGAFHYAHWNLFANMLRNGLSMFPVYDILDYCDLVIDGINDPSSLNNPYDGDIEDWEKQAIINNYTIINYYGLSGFELSGSFDLLTGYSGSDVDLGALDFFRELSITFNNRLGQVNGNLFGFIPSYILVFMFALIFIRILRK